MKHKEFTITFNNKLYHVRYVVDVDVAIDYLSHLSSSLDPVLGFDFETEALPEYQHINKAAVFPQYSKIRLCQIGDSKVIIILDFKYLHQSSRANEFYKAFKQLLKKKRFVAHYAMFELQFLLAYGVKNPILDCSLLMSKILVHAGRHDEAGVSYSLAGLVKSFFNIELPKDVQASDWSIPTLTHEQLVYAATDAPATLDLYNLIQPALFSQNLERYYNLIRECLPVIAKMQMNGIKFDMEKHTELAHKWRHDLAEALKDVKELTGLPTVTGPKVAAWLSKTLDPATLAEWPLTANKKLKVDAATLSDFSYIEVVKPFSTYQKYATLSSKYGLTMGKYINQATGRIHANYNLQGARTGRMSCSNPNEQNAPKDKEYRANFIAEKGYVFCRADYSQIELRVIAELSKDKVMLNAFRTGEDLHDITAAHILGCSISKLRNLPDYDTYRRAAKNLNFLLVYGGGAGTYAAYSKKSYGVEKSIEEAFEEITKWKELYAGVAQWQEQQSRHAGRALQSITPMGKVRRLDPDNYYGASLNTPVQGGACEAMMISLILIQKRLQNKKFDAKIVKCVHDEILVECKHNVKKRVGRIITKSMTEAFLQVCPGGVTEGLVDVTTGKTWKEASD